MNYHVNTSWSISKFEFSMCNILNKSSMYSKNRGRGFQSKDVEWLVGSLCFEDYLRSKHVWGKGQLGVAFNSVYGIGL